jgi:SMODS-associated and fused to various effectors sensor domain
VGSAKRPRIDPKVERAVWAAAAGRCTFCNRLVSENEDTGTLASIGELAHNVGWSKSSPRGNSSKTSEERSGADNLILLCRNCHKPVDDQGVIGCYSVERLYRFKKEHESRIRFLTEIGADRKALVVRLVGPVRGVSPELTYDTVLTASTAAGVFPATLPHAYRNAIEIDLREYGEGTPEANAVSIARINEYIARVNEGIKRDQVSRLAIFAFARIPLLVHLGAQFDDKVPMLIFQRQRVSDANAWSWPLNPPDPPQFTIDKLRDGSVDHVALVLNISGTIHLRELPQDVQETYTVYTVAPASPAESGPSVISSPAACANFEGTLRRFLAQVEKEHGKIPEIAVFPAVPISCAIILGKVLMPHVSPSLIIFDRNEHNVFLRALEVRR